MADRPENIPEKFWDADNGTVKTDALLNSYRELEQKFSQQNANSKPPANDPPKNDGPPKVNLGDFDTELNQHGDLSPTSRQKLIDSGIPQEMVDAYVQGRNAQRTSAMEATYKLTNGQENYESMRAWVGQNLGQDALKTLDDAVRGDNQHLRDSVVNGMFSKYRDANPGEPNLIEGRGSSGSSGGVYGEWPEVEADMAKPEYRKSEAFRQQVAAKIARSPALGQAQSL